MTDSDDHVAGAERAPERIGPFDEATNAAWTIIQADIDLANARRALSIHELRMIIRHTADSFAKRYVPHAVYESAVKGRQDFRAALVEARADLSRAPADGWRDIARVVETCAKIADYRIERLKAGQARCVSTQWALMNLAQQDEAKIIADGIRAIYPHKAETDSVAFRAPALAEECERLRDVLETYQWVSGPSGSFCPACKKSPSAGHWELCEIRAALSSTPVAKDNKQ